MKVTRRQFLRGSGAALALPLLPSLLPRTARAAVVSGPKTFVGISAGNGRFQTHGPQSRLMPITAAPVNGIIPGFESVPVPGKYTIHRGSLSALAAANGGRISDIIDANYTPLLKKMFMLQGLDYLSMGAAHHTAQFGAQNRNTGQATSNVPFMASLDQVIADFYRGQGHLSNVVTYSATRLDSGAGYANSYRANGDVTTGHYSDPSLLWERYFGNVNIPTATRTLLVDRVLSDYKSVRANPRLGSEDRQRLDTHVAQLAATETRVKKIASGGCSQTRPVSTVTDRRLLLQTMNDVIVSIVSCGLASIFMGWANAHLDADPGTWHTWSHNAFDQVTGVVSDPAMYAKLVDQNRSVVRDLGFDLAKKLDAVGQLDNTIILVIQEHSYRGHETWNIPVVGFGSGGGAFVTDTYVDYRALAEGRSDIAGFTCYGFPMNQLYANVLQAMGMAPSDYEKLNRPRAGWLNVFKPGSGYGCPSIHPAFENFGGQYALHYKQFFSGHDLSEKLPLVRT